MRSSRSKLAREGKLPGDRTMGRSDVSASRKKRIEGRRLEGTARVGGGKPGESSVPKSQLRDVTQLER